MLPSIASTNTFNPSTPVVNTTIPGTNVERVLPQAIAPSVSSADIRNNTQGNNAVTLSAEEQVVANDNTSTTQETSSNFLTQLQSAQSVLSNSGVQATFVAQLAAQDSSPQTQVILVQYEKIIKNGSAKAAPASEPPSQDAPSSLFGRLLQSDKPTAPVPVIQPPVASNQQPVEAIQQSVVEAHYSTRTGKSTSTNNGNDESNSEDNANVAGVDATGSITPQAIHAYAATASRIANIKLPANELA